MHKKPPSSHSTRENSVTKEIAHPGKPSQKPSYQEKFNSIACKYKAMTNLSLEETRTVTLREFTSHHLEFTEEEKEENFYESDKIVAHSVSCFLLLIGVYLLAALCCYEYKVYHKNVKKGYLSRYKDEMLQNQSSDAMRWLCLVACALAILRYVFDMVEIWKGQRSHVVCSSMRQIKTGLLSIAFSCSYNILWFRQRNLYKAPFLKLLSNKTLRFFSKTCIIFILVVSVLTPALYIFARGYRPSVRGCVLAWSSTWTMLPVLLQLTFTILFQILLLGLLIYPLYQQRHITKNLVLSNQKKITALIKRVTIATLVSVLTDGLAELVVFLVFSNSFTIFGHLVYDVDLLINIIAVICSFTDWKNRLWPRCAKAENFNENMRQKNFENSAARARATISSKV